MLLRLALPLRSRWDLHNLISTLPILFEAGTHKVSDTVERTLSRWNPILERRVPLQLFLYDLVDTESRSSLVQLNVDGIAREESVDLDCLLLTESAKDT